MTGSFKKVDLFAGPGGLAEGFASLRDDNGAGTFEIALSVEKEPSAFATLRAAVRATSKNRTRRSRENELRRTLRFVTPGRAQTPSRQ